MIGARLAREAAANFTDRPRWVVGSMGPGTQLPSLGQTTFERLEESYTVQARGLLDGGVDALLIETAFDLLQVKSTIAAVVNAFDATAKRVPLMVQVTIQPEGTMLLGSEIGAAVATVHAFEVVDSIGINCATGPVEMVEHVRYICQNSGEVKCCTELREWRAPAGIKVFVCPPDQLVESPCSEVDLYLPIPYFRVIVFEPGSQFSQLVCFELLDGSLNFLNTHNSPLLARFQI